MNRGTLLGLVLLSAACRVERATPPPRFDSTRTAAFAIDSMRATTSFFLGLRTVKYTAPDLKAASAWYQQVTGVAPYFDEPFYVGFNIGGFELGIVPEASATRDRPEAGVAYWGVTNADSAWNRLLQLGATPQEAIQDVGGGVRIGAVHDPFGNVLGIVENPHFRIAK